MTNNDLLRSVRYALDLSDGSMLQCFSLGGANVLSSRLDALLRREEDPGFEPLADALFSRFLDGLVTLRRGRREEPPARNRGPEPELTNNRILRALRIALELKDTDLINIMELADTPVSKAEINALFRREDHRNYQPCGNQFLRNFMRGLARWHRGAQGPEE